MKTREYPLFLTIMLMFCLPTAHGTAPSRAIFDKTSVAVQGGWNYSRLLYAAVAFANQIILHAPDRYGAKSTPLWLAVLDPAAFSGIHQWM